MLTVRGTSCLNENSFNYSVYSTDFSWVYALTKLKPYKITSISPSEMSWLPGRRCVLIYIYSTKHPFGIFFQLIFLCVVFSSAHQEKSWVGFKLLLSSESRKIWAQWYGQEKTRWPEIRSLYCSKKQRTFFLRQIFPDIFCAFFRTTSCENSSSVFSCVLNTLRKLWFWIQAVIKLRIPQNLV